MKNIIKLYMISILLTGCMDTVTRFWNNGIPMSEKEKKQYSYCFDEAKKHMREHPESTPDSPEVQAWRREFRNRITQCEMHHRRNKQASQSPIGYD